MKSQWRARNPMIEKWFNCCIGCNPKGFVPELPLLGLQTLECPKCKMQKGRKSWMPSQWAKKDPIVPMYYKCCKECDREAFLPTKGALQAQWFEIMGTVAQVRDGPTQIMQEFISDWMQRLLRRVCKELSHRGCLNIDGGKYDPGNWIYYLGRKFLLPELLACENWNNETVGDIWESLLASTEDGGFAMWMRRYLTDCVAFFELVTPERFDSLWTSHGRSITFDSFQEWLSSEGLLAVSDGSTWIVQKWDRGDQL
jgi:hypothetical protein